MTTWIGGITFAGLDGTLLTVGDDSIRATDQRHARPVESLGQSLPIGRLILNVPVASGRIYA